ncbi:MAG: SurA N-terminal domain-containing protein [Proteobacteria bacterium]|nr:SurA N-terminal domain-containing protein [Pseudomonadota bacterium]
MFDFVHEKRRLVQIVLLLIILPFAFFGVDSYRHAGDTDAPATVNGSKITKQEFETALRQQQDKMRQMLGANFDPAMFDKPEMKSAVLENLVAQRLLIERAKAVGLTVTDQQIAQVIGGIDAFKEAGKFDKARYTSALSAQNMTPMMFEARIKDELSGQQLRDAYTQNGYAANTVADNIIAINEQQRVVSIAQVPLQSFIAQAKADEAEIKAYYEQNQKEFQVPEQVKVEYVKFSIRELMAKADVKTEDVRKYYDEHLSEFSTPEQRQASHILLTVAATAPQAEQDKVKARAEQLLRQVKQAPAKFAELAKQNSQDPGSAANGGDLGLFGRGMMVKPFDEAVFALKVGEISALVKSDFGYHIIKLTAIKASNAAPFDEVSAAVMAKLRQQNAADSFAELADKFSNAVYEQSDTLKPAAALAGVKVEQSAWLTKGVAADEVWTPKMLQAVFSDDVIKNHRNTAAVEIAPSTLLAARMLEHKPAAVRVLIDVTDSIKQKIISKKALDMAVKQGRMLLGQLQQGTKPALDWSVAQTITHAQHGALDVAMVRQLFQADSTKLPQYVGVEAPGGGFVIVRVDAVKNAEVPDDVKRGRYAQQVRQMTGEEMFQAYIADAKKDAKIKLKLPEAATAKP